MKKQRQFTVYTTKNGQRYLTHNRRVACEIVQELPGFVIMVDGDWYDRILFYTFRSAVQYFQERELASWNEGCI